MAVEIQGVTVCHVSPTLYTVVALTQYEIKQLNITGNKHNNFIATIYITFKDTLFKSWVY